MDIEYEVKFLQIDKDQVRKKLESVGAKLIHPEFLQKRAVFHLPTGHEITGGWLRVRQEYDKVTMSLKIVTGTKITDQRELGLTIDDFEKGIQMLEMLGCRQKAYQENKREMWVWKDCMITLDEWPFLPPFVEVEGPSESEVKSTSQALGFDYGQGVCGAADSLIADYYQIDEKLVNNHTPIIVFDGENPYLVHVKK